MADISDSSARTSLHHADSPLRNDAIKLAYTPEARTNSMQPRGDVIKVADGQPFPIDSKDLDELVSGITDSVKKYGGLAPEAGDRLSELIATQYGKFGAAG